MSQITTLTCLVVGALSFFCNFNVWSNGSNTKYYGFILWQPSPSSQIRLNDYDIAWWQAQALLLWGAHSTVVQLNHFIPHHHCPHPTFKPCYHSFLSCQTNNAPRKPSGNLLTSISICYSCLRSTVFWTGTSWTTLLGLYLETVMIQIHLLPANFQFTVVSSSWTTSLGFFLIQLNLFPTNFHMNVNLSSQYPVYETTSEDNSPPKLPLVILFSVYISLIITLEKLFSVWTNCSKDIF